MPSLSNHQSTQTTKMLLIGNSGAGKSGSLASLASEGYNVRIIDLDNGLDVLKNYLTKSNGLYKPEAIQNVRYVTVTDEMKPIGGRLLPNRATVWQRAIGLLHNWKEDDLTLGPISTWTPQDILVIDSLSFLSNAALAFILSLNGRLGQKPQQGDWYDAQNLVEGLLQMLYDASVKCNVIVMAHITYIGNEGGLLSGYPNSLGSKLPPKIGRYFNSILLARSEGRGTSAKRKIITNQVDIVELKNTAPLSVKPEYDLSTGLAEYFKAVRQ